jgi:hypothetical protein
MTNPLDPVLAWYTTASDAVRVTRRVIAGNVAGAVTAKHTFHGRAAADNEAALARAQDELDRLVVLGLVALFERALRDHLLALPVVPGPTGVPLQDTIRARLVRDMEYWSVEHFLLDELFSAVDPALRGNAKQLIKYRNWVAHGHTQSQPAPLVILPPAAHQRLTDFLTQAGII